MAAWEGPLFLLLNCVCARVPQCVGARRGRVWERARAPAHATPNLAQVWDTAAALNRSAEPSLQSLERQLAARPEPLRAVQRLQSLLETLLGYTAAIPFWRNPAVSLEALAEQVDLYDWYRCGPLSFLPRSVPTSLYGPVGAQLPVPEVFWGEGLGPLVVTVAGVPHGDIRYKSEGSPYPRTACGSSSGLFAWLCPSTPFLLPWDWAPRARPTCTLCPQVAGLLGPAAVRRGHLPPGTGRPHPQLQGDPGRVSLWALRAGGGGGAPAAPCPLSQPCPTLLSVGPAWRGVQPSPRPGGC